MNRFCADPINPDCIEFAVSLLKRPEPERNEQLQSLLLERQLSKRVHELNQLLDQPAYKELAIKALYSMGFEMGLTH